LQKVKDRILDYLSVRRLKPSMKGPILCFVGPPGVGKTSLGKSIARALGRKFVRLSLGGVHDEAEIRGHRRTYIGALPGQIIQGIRRAETKDPVFMLDEIDKVGRDFRGDPASALLEALDPEQNSTFRDNYLDVTFDLVEGAVHHDREHARSDRRALARPHGDHRAAGLYRGREGSHLVSVPDPAADRRKRNHARADRISEEAVSYIIRHYTREAGVRNLERTIGTICRKQARRLAEGKTEKLVVTKEIVQEFLGGIKVRSEGEIAERTKRAGVVVGLAWTPSGGDVLFVEANQMKGKGGLTITGQIQDVMRESMQAGLSWVRSNAKELGHRRRIFRHPRHPHSRAGGSDTERWSVSGRHHRDRASVVADRKASSSADLP
jgi:ATP-dependent Lon protease